MKKPVWQSDSKGTPRERFVSFSAGRDVVAVKEADAALVPCDIWTNQAHAKGLRRIGLYSEDELKQVLAALDLLEGEWTAGRWRLDPSLEDVHINIEAYVGEKCGEAIGGRLHSGRSRNDQVATDMLVFIREIILRELGELIQLALSLCDHAIDHIETVMPGYTHHRKATIATWGHWCAAHAQGIARDARRLVDLLDRIDECPLGAAASYGTPWKLDREYTAALLAFSRVRENTLDAVTSRGEAEAEAAHALAMVLKRLSGLSQDLILFSTEEFGFLSLPPAFTTGSSIMPQKRNPDFAEAIKGKFHVAAGLAQSLLTIDSCNLSGYNKDVQWSKYLFMDAAREAEGAAALLANVIDEIAVNADRMKRAAETGFLNAVDIADHLASRQGIPFRTAYRILSDAVGRASGGQFALDELNAAIVEHGGAALEAEEFEQLNNPAECVKNREHTGAPHPDRVREHLDRLSEGMATIRDWRDAALERIQNARGRSRTAAD